MVRILKLAQMTTDDLAKLKRRAELDIDMVLPIAQEVITAIAQKGDAGVIEYARKFDYAGANPENIKVTPEEFAQAQNLIEPDVKLAVEQAFRNIKEVHQRQMPEEFQLAEIDTGIFAGEKITPLPRVGLYVPRGKGAFPSMMLMLTVPAMVAGVEKIVVCTPPDKQGKVEPVSLVVAQMAGVTEVYKLGGVQALAAMALGTATVPKVDKLIGPCSIYGAAAKRLLFGTVDVGLPAGPSESIVLADETTNPQLAALDLLIEAEHGPDSAALLVTHSETVAQQASQFALDYMAKLPTWRREFCETGLGAYGGIILTSSIQESIDFVNDYAPEHLEILVDDPFSLIGKIKNAGEILLGKYTPSSAATYAIGVNAVLPTGGFARSYSAVSVYDFLKRSTLAYLTSEGFEKVKQTTKVLAKYEEFSAHGMAIEERDHLL
ncbi:histidinol dehydrogenase [Aphanothece sacrum]|uniref:histidinol dehydrogenase n=1 Tax=Aphanothece sacrum FPU1 TaxID=1920663 RepID=A0A401IC08_APHSA|nr:histidinol dehydrogenase [Aphanothece sacrum]GBF78772.1 histidinol dehydrogenase [Aphanothece sacrum FPU1]GBF83004.1 histidinol dehydrogenase HisD [Aphanothece sacrum FPU3]